MCGSLFLCPTPIGNMEDVSIRMLRAFASANLIAAEDTRVTLKLMNAYGIKRTLVCYREHNKNEMGPVLIKKLLAGDTITLVTDAGTPCISDPGEDLVKMAIAENIKVIPVAGPCAAITGLITSGLSTERFVFEGFLPRGKKLRKPILKNLETETRTMIFYESPYRLFDTLYELYETLGDRKIAICRELTKVHETVYHYTISEALKHFRDEEPRGEFVLIVEGINPKKIKEGKEKLWDFMSLKEHMNIYISRGYEKKEAMRQVAIDRDLPKRIVYMELNSVR